MKNIELLAPAGSIESLYAAVNAGADALYIGGNMFGARAYAENPDNETLLKAMDYVHLNNKKMYLTVNTLLKEHELNESLYTYLKPFYENGLDAVLVQDLGVYKFIRENFPNLPIHASTQMAICNVEGARLLKNMGAERVVTARELSLKELKHIKDEVDIEIESFIHGAMCYCYSGMCLFSSILGGRSGNRGRCAGPCRQPYNVSINGHVINNKDSMYCLSMKDMNTLDIIPDIIDAGVDSLKIEGRMKSKEYAAFITSTYRKYIDMYMEYGRDGFKVEKTDRTNLYSMYSRTKSIDGYYKKHNSKDMISYSKPAYSNTNEELINETLQKYCNDRLKRNISCKCILHKNEEAVLNIWDDMSKVNISVNGEIVEGAKNRPLDEKSVLKQLKKTGNDPISFGDIKIEMDVDIFIPVSKLNDLRRNGINEFISKFLSKYYRKAEDTYIKKNNTISKSLNEKYVLSVLVTTKEQFEVVIKKDEVDKILIATDVMDIDEINDCIHLAKKKNIQVEIVLPYILRDRNISYIQGLIDKFSEEKFVIRNVDQLGLIKRMGISNFSIDNSLYSYNKNAYEFYKEMGADIITLPFELNEKELKITAMPDNEIIVYGYIPLMISAGCINKNYDKCDGIYKNITIQDRRKAVFSVRNYCKHCYNVIYNNVPVSLMGVSDRLSEINTNNYRINLTIENKGLSASILEKYIDIFYYKRYCDDLNNYTRGHFNRGVE